MARLKTMTTQFIDGEPNGVRICRCTLSTYNSYRAFRPGGDCRMTGAARNPSRESLANLLRNADKIELDAS